MKTFRLAIAALALSTTFSASTHALSVEEQTDTQKINLADPDNKIPVAHIADDGKMTAGPGFQFQDNSKSAFTFGATPSPSSDAFSRALDNQQK